MYHIFCKLRNYFSQLRKEFDNKKDDKKKKNTNVKNSTVEISPVDNDNDNNDININLNKTKMNENSGVYCIDIDESNQFLISMTPCFSLFELVGYSYDSKDKKLLLDTTKLESNNNKTHILKKCLKEINYVLDDLKPTQKDQFKINRYVRLLSNGATEMKARRKYAGDPKVCLSIYFCCFFDFLSCFLFFCF